MNTLYEVLEHGSIVASDEEFGALVTVNGAYFNVWFGSAVNGYTCHDCYSLSSDNGLYGQDITKLQDRAEAILKSVLTPNEEDK